MKCNKAQTLLDDYIDGYLHSPQTDAFTKHIGQCDTCSEMLSSRKLLLALLNQIPPTEAPRADLYQRVINARHQHVKHINHRHIKWFGIGALTSLAASLLIAILLNILPDSEFENHQPISNTVFMIEPTTKHHTLRVVFNSKTTLGDVKFSIIPPDSIDIEGYVGDRIVAWHGRLKKGENLLKIPLIVRNTLPGTLLVSIEHNSERRLFTVKVNTTELTSAAS